MAPSMKLLGHTLLAASGVHAALNVNFDDQSSIKAAASVVAKDLMTFYKGEEPGNVPGLLPGPPPDGGFYWWTGGLFWDTLLQYRHRAGDDQFDDRIARGLQWQMGNNGDYQPRNWSASMGNDDQAVWGLASLAAAGYGLPEPEKDQDSNQTSPSWVQASQNVFDLQSHKDRRIANGTCEGALRWQVYATNNGYNYISTNANAAYFAIGAELAYVAKNKTAGESAAKTWDVLSSIGLIDDKFNVFEGVHVPDCKDINRIQFSTAAGLLIQGAAFMYNATGSEDVWKQRLDGLLSRTLEIFFFNDIMVEPACEEAGTCNTDQMLARGVLLQGLGTATQYAPYTMDRILPKLKTTARAAAASCSGGDNGRQCGYAWTASRFDDHPGAAAQMNALAALTSIMAPGPPVDLSGNAGAGADSGKDDEPEPNAAGAVGSNAAGLLAGLGLAAWALL